MQQKRFLTRVSLMALVAIAGSLTLASCSKGSDKPPEGQVVAKLAGQDITQLEVNAELARMSPPADMPRRQAEKVALQNIIVRRMLAKTADEQKLDKTPEFIMAERRAQEQLRVEALAQSIRAKVPQPSGDEVSNFIDKNPDLFRNHKVYTLDQITFLAPEPADAKKLDLKNLHSMAAVAAALQAQGIAFQRQATNMDSLAVQPEFLKEVTALRAKTPEEPFAFTRKVPNAPRPVVFVNNITGVEVVPFLGEKAATYAKNRIYAERVQKALQDEMKTEREKAQKITVYQNGWEPDADQKIDPGAVTGKGTAPVAEQPITPAT